MLAGKSFLDKANDNYEFEEYEAALINFDKALEINPQNPEAHFGKSVALYTLDKKEAALVAVDKAIEINPEGENFYGFKGGILLSMGQKEAALAAFQKALEINPNDSPCAANIGDCLADLGKFKEAVDAYDHAIKIDPKNKSAYSDKGFVLYLVGEIDEAIKWYDRQIEIASSLSDMWVLYFRKGTALQDLNKDTEAWEYFQKGMDIFNQGELEGNRFIFSNGEDEILNVLEVQLISGIKGLFALPTLPVAQDDPEEVKTLIQDFNRKIDALKLKFINAAFSTKKNRYNHPQDEFDQLKKELEEIKNMHKQITNDIAEIKADIQTSYLKEVAEVKKGLKALEEQDPDLLAYCKTFYWLATNLFSAYRAQNEDLLVTEDKKATNLLADVASGTPIVGEVLNQLNTIIDGINGGVKENNFNNKATAINKVVQAKFGAEDDISLNISKVAIAITLAKKKTILYPEISNPGLFIISQKIKTGLEWLSSQVDDIKEKVLPFVDLQDKESIGATLALQDVMLFMAYICKNHEYIIKRKEGLDNQIVSIVECNGLEQLLEGRADAFDMVDTFETTLEVKNSKATPEVTQEVKNPEGCNCAMF